MDIHVNGNQVSLETNEHTIVTLLQSQGFEQFKGLAVAINEQIVPRNQWETTLLQSNDQVLIITATQGG